MMLSLNSSVVSTDPGGHAANRIARGSPAARLAPKMSPNRMYELPIVGWMFSQPGSLGSAGGVSGSMPAWQAAQAAPYSTAPFGRVFLRMPITPDDSGSSHRSRPPAGFATQSGSLMT